MPDFSQLLRKPSGEAKRPPVLPVGDYSGIIKSFEYGDDNQKKTPYVRFHLALTGWPASAPQQWTNTDSEGKSYTVTQADVDLSKKQMRKDYFLRSPDGDDNILWRLDEFLKSCKLPLGAEYEAMIPQVVGQSIIVGVGQYLNKNTNEIGNQVDKLMGA